ncbi:hypothetical protein D3C72_2098460 [compost metagenome]
MGAFVQVAAEALLCLGIHLAEGGDPLRRNAFKQIRIRGVDLQVCATAFHELLHSFDSPHCSFLKSHIRGQFILGAGCGFVHPIQMHILGSRQVGLLRQFAGKGGAV